MVETGYYLNLSAQSVEVFWGFGKSTIRLRQENAYSDKQSCHTSQSVPEGDILGSIHKRVHLITQLESPLRSETWRTPEANPTSFFVTYKVQDTEPKHVNKPQCLNYVHFFKDTNLKHTEEEGLKNPTADSSYESEAWGVSQTYTNIDIIFCHRGTKYRSSDEMECGEGG